MARRILINEGMLGPLVPAQYGRELVDILQGQGWPAEYHSGPGAVWEFENDVEEGTFYRSLEEAIETLVDAAGGHYSWRTVVTYDLETTAADLEVMGIGINQVRNGEKQRDSETG